MLLFEAVKCVVNWKKINTSSSTPYRHTRG
jgi:hypothetical protein